MGATWADEPSSERHLHWDGEKERLLMRGLGTYSFGPLQFVEVSCEVTTLPAQIPKELLAPLAHFSHVANKQREIIFKRPRAAQIALRLSIRCCGREKRKRREKSSRDAPKNSSRDSIASRVWINIFYCSARPATFTKKFIVLVGSFLDFFCCWMNSLYNNEHASHNTNFTFIKSLFFRDRFASDLQAMLEYLWRFASVDWEFRSVLLRSTVVVD